MALNLYLKDGFESTSLFWGDVGLSLQLCFWGVAGLSLQLFFFLGGGGRGGCGFESTSLFWGGGGGDVGLSLQICFWGVVGLSPFFCGEWGGHGDRVVTLSPPTSGAGVRSPSRPQVGKLVVACRWSAVYSTEP